MPTVTARNSFRIVKAGLSEYCTASRKTSTAVPPPLFRGEARTWCGARDSAGLGGLVRIGSNPSGSRPNFFGRQHLTFDKGGKCDGAKQGIVRFWKVMRGEGLLSFCKGCRNTESEGDSTGLEGYAGRGGV